MVRRIVTALILLSVVFAGFYFDGMRWLLVGMVSLIAVFCTFELTQMMKLKGLRVYRRIASWGVLLLLLEAVTTHLQFSMIVFGVAVCGAWLVRMPGKVEGSWGDISATCFTLAYVGLPFAAMLRVFLASPQGEAWLLMTMTIIWTTDSFALFTGKAIGKHKLWPKISPGKTWEGSVGGTIGALIATMVFYGFFREHYFPGVHLWEFLVYGLVFSVLGQLGDLAESLLKRDVGVKDSGSELTGHGGFLDLMDAVLFCALPMLAYLQIFHPGVLEPTLAVPGQ